MCMCTYVCMCIVVVFFCVCVSVLGEGRKERKKETEVDAQGITSPLASLLSNPPFAPSSFLLTSSIDFRYHVCVN
jgi:hypothetical protein